MIRASNFWEKLVWKDVQNVVRAASWRKAGAEMNPVVRSQLHCHSPAAF